MHEMKNAQIIAMIIELNPYPANVENMVIS